MLKPILIAATLMWAGSAYADEVVIHHDTEAPATTTSKTVETHESSDGCASKTVHKENDEGDSKTVHKTNCD